MCLPLAIALPLIATVGGAGLNFMGQSQADKASQKTFSRERERQKAFEGQQTALFQDSLDKTAEMQDPAAQAAAAAARESTLASAVVSAAPTAGGYLPGSSSAPAVVGEAAVKAGAASDVKTASLGRALAALGGTTDLMQKNDINIGRNSGEIAQIGGFKRGSLSVLQSEMEAAKQKGAALRAIGGLAQQIGGAFLSGGVGGAPISSGAGGLGGLVSQAGQGGGWLSGLIRPGSGLGPI